MPVVDWVFLNFNVPWTKYSEASGKSNPNDSAINKKKPSSLVINFTSGIHSPP
jgi:hypothetical protein